nr:MAG TPA: hypothetical protein [Caudoviricetes sp.]
MLLEREGKLGRARPHKKYAIRRCVGRRPSDTTYALIS